MLMRVVAYRMQERLLGALKTLPSGGC